MLNYIIPVCGESVYHMLFWFFTYSILGWMVESVYMSFCNKKLTNRGFIHGPICPIYGFGGVGVHIALRHFAGNYIALYITGAMLATALEFCTARLMIRCFGFVWWDYSNKPWNYKSIICLESTVAWGFYTILEFAVLQKLVFHFMYMVPERIGQFAVIGIAVYFLIDMGYCLHRARKGEVKGEENNLLAVDK